MGALLAIEDPYIRRGKSQHRLGYVDYNPTRTIASISSSSYNKEEVKCIHCKIPFLTYRGHSIQECLNVLKSSSGLIYDLDGILVDHEEIKKNIMILHDIMAKSEQVDYMLSAIQEIHDDHEKDKQEEKEKQKVKENGDTKTPSF